VAPPDGKIENKGHPWNSRIFVADPKGLTVLSHRSPYGNNNLLKQQPSKKAA
jgi:hypothetical protein